MSFDAQALTVAQGQGLAGCWRFLHTRPLEASAR